MTHHETAADLAARLRERGLRMTPQRQLVLDAVRHLQHATPEQISDAIPAIDVTTVYRNLEVLEEIGFVKHTHLGHGAASYRPAEDDHVHVVCHECGGVVDAPHDLVEQLADRLRSERGFTLDRSHFTVFGRCARCSVTAPDSAGSATEPAAPEPAAREQRHTHGR
jgi:Fur family ferric uptake transcriptional regulator